ncbi:hypothetical protein V1520DRAFT_88539 [Lipomyces starkeyi]|uniref:Uncharacterized protein n=1 Tax=Lipomyces starkeyi NRRL Y-11557 TaxID=675824 RepID=A0A1E3Q679_LIPST|nr:hypothetical protein LIPSTDRAFT_63477 [Lipomyces starkeyi NRRL Y-11557]
MPQAATTAVTVAVAASPSPTPLMSPPATEAAPIAKSSIIYDDEKNSATITIAPTATDSDDDPDIEFLANALQCHLSFNITKADSPSLSSDLQSSSTSSSLESMNSTISSVLSSSRTTSTSKMPSYLGLKSSPSHNTTPFSMGGFVKKVAKPGLARKVSLAEFQKQQVFLEFRTWSDESSDTDDEDEDDGETQFDEEEQAVCDCKTGDEKQPRIASGHSAVLLRRLKKRVEQDTLKAPKPVLARIDTSSSAKSMITIMSASVDATESCNSSEKARLLDKIETLAKELNEARAGYVELNNRYKILAARYDEGLRENEQLRSRMSNHESKIESRRPPGPPPGPPTLVTSNAHVPGAKPDGPLLKSTQGVQSSGRPYPASSAATPRSQALSKPAATLNAPHMNHPNSKVYELCGALAYSNNALKKVLAMSSGAGVVNIPNMLEKTIERPGYRFEPNSVTIICCSYVTLLHFQFLGWIAND